MSVAPTRDYPRPARKVTLPNGTVADQSDVLAPIREKRANARFDRRRYEAGWSLAQQFVAGRQWVGWDPRYRRVIAEPNPRKRERHTVNVLTRHFWTAIGQVYGEEFRPDMLFSRDDQMAESITRQARRAYEFAWKEECDADAVILDLIIEAFAFGTAAIQCRYDPIAGEYRLDVPVHHETGKPILDPQAARAYVGDRRYFGEDVQLKSLFEGKLRWHVRSPFHILPPPGIVHERDFPYVMLEEACLLEDVQATYGQPAAALSEQALNAVDLVGVADAGADDPGTGGNGKLKGHVLVTTYFERPTPKHPKGQVVEFSQDTVLRVTDELPYKVGGEYKAGIVFFKYHRLPRRFWAQGLLEPGIGPQRQRNRARSQMIEMKDKNLGRVYAYKGTINESNRPTGKIMELIEVSRSSPSLPQETNGVAPGPWIENEARMNDEDLERVMGQSGVSLGEAPRGVSAYSAFALLAEQDDRRVGPILKGFRVGFIELSKFTMAGIRKWWPAEKQIVLAGPNDEVESFLFNKTKLPDEVFFSYGTGGPPRPSSPAAQIQLVFDLFDRSISSGKPLPLDWLVASLDAGKPLPMPKIMDEVQQQKAELENNLMNQGEPVSVAPSDTHQIHIPIHQTAIASLQLIPDAQDVIGLMQQHLAEHEQQAQAQQASASSVPGLQGPMGALGSPNAAPQPAAGGGGLPPGALASHLVNALSPLPPNVS